MTRLSVCSEDWEPQIGGAAVKIEKEYYPPASNHPDPVTFDGVVKEKESSELMKKKAVVFPLSCCLVSDSAVLSLSDLMWFHLSDLKITSAALYINAIRADGCVQQDRRRSWDNTPSQQRERGLRGEKIFAQLFISSWILNVCPWLCSQDDIYPAAHPKRCFLHMSLTIPSVVDPFIDQIWSNGLNTIDECPPSNHRQNVFSVFSEA